MQMLSKSPIHMTNTITKTDARYKKVQVGKDQEKAQSEKDSHSKKTR